jgi:hypothetical protein
LPNRAIEIHDSVLEKVILIDDRAVLHFSSAYIHQSEGTPAVDAGSGWVQRAILRIDKAVISGRFAELPTTLTDGQIQMGENRDQNMIPIPLSFKGKFELKLVPMWRAGEVVSFSGTGAELELIGEPEYVEEFRP